MEDKDLTAGEQSSESRQASVDPAIELAHAHDEINKVGEAILETCPDQIGDESACDCAARLIRTHCAPPAPAPEPVEHPALCVCQECVAARNAAAPIICSADPAQYNNAAGHPANCICQSCVAAVTGSAALLAR